MSTWGYFAEFFTVFFIAQRRFLDFLQHGKQGGAAGKRVLFRCFFVSFSCCALSMFLSTQHHYFRDLTGCKNFLELKRWVSSEKIKTLWDNQRNAPTEYLSTGGMYGVQRRMERELCISYQNFSYFPKSLGNSY
jgi:hypothetical protein